MTPQCLQPLVRTLVTLQVWYLSLPHSTLLWLLSPNISAYSYERRLTPDVSKIELLIPHQKIYFSKIPCISCQGRNSNITLEFSSFQTVCIESFTRSQIPLKITQFPQIYHHCSNLTCHLLLPKPWQEPPNSLKTSLLLSLLTVH